MSILRFTHDGTSTDFYIYEVPKIVVSTVQKSDIWQDLQEYYHIYKIGNSYKKLTITFDIREMTTWTKLETLWGYKDSYYQPDIMQCFYEYGINTSTNIWVQMKRDDFQLRFFQGKYKAKEKLKLVFYEAVPEGVAVVSNQIIGT